MAKEKAAPAAPAVPARSTEFIHPRFGKLTNVRDRGNGTSSGYTESGRRVTFWNDTPSAAAPVAESEPVNVATPAQPVPDAAADPGTAAG